jgi:hypothetical protein
VSVFGAERRVLEALWLMLGVDGEFLRVSWSPGAGLAPLEVPAPVGEEQVLQRLVAEFDAEELTGPRRLVEEEQRSELVSYDFAVADGPADWLGWVQRLSEDRDVRLGAGSRRGRGFGTCGQAAVLWARVESKREAVNLERFRPVPTLVLREGASCRRVALWSLRRPLSYDWLVRANRRIAHKLFAPKKWAEPEFAFPAPGSCLRVGRSRPVPIHVEHFEASIFHPREVVGALRDAPDPDAWREKAAA